MKHVKLVSLGLTLAMTASVALAAEGDKETPPWMEDVKVKGRSTYLVPKGAKREVIGAQVVVEPPNEYVARRLYEIEQYLEKRFKSIEDSQDELKKVLEELKADLITIKAEMKEKVELGQKEE